jgi:glycosyltransferase involved in cell wall biosynthesis
VFVHNSPAPSGTFRRTLGYRPRLLRSWATRVVAIASAAKPDLVRCYGANLNAYAASEIKRQLGIPYAVSLHINPDEDVRGRATGVRNRVQLHALRAVERHALRRADLVLPVYEPIVPYLRRLGVTRYRVAYNVLNGRYLRRKSSYALHEPVRVISVGRQFAAKNPEQLIRAVGSLPNVRLTLVGDGPFHELLERTAEATRAPERFVFHRALPNNELCELLASQDVYATHSDYWELSKSVIEALLTGLPVVVNRRPGAPVPELTPEIAFLVENTPESWARALTTLIEDAETRERLGRAGAAVAWRRWAPEATEAAFVEIYRSLLSATVEED